MLTYKGLRYNGNDQDFIRKVLEDLATLRDEVDQLKAQSKIETRVKP